MKLDLNKMKIFKYLIFYIYLSNFDKFVCDITKKKSSIKSFIHDEIITNEKSLNTSNTIFSISYRRISKNFFSGKFT